MQHLLKKNADSIVQQLIEERGCFYVCGDVSMAADVGRTLQNIFEENAAMSSDEARQLIESMKVRKASGLSLTSSLPLGQRLLP